MANDYELIDSGNRLKLERFGKFRLLRPAALAFWQPRLKSWDHINATFTRDERWDVQKEWVVEVDNLKFFLKLTDHGHVGLFPEHIAIWQWVRKKLQKRKGRVLNLFAYTGGLSLAALDEGAEVCHVDASEPTVSWARKNAALNGLDKRPIRWIVDDVIKFLKREIKRGSFYDAIILDPPSFGRGSKKEVFKLERDIELILTLCKEVFSKDPQFLVFTSHTPGMTPYVLQNMLQEHFGNKNLSSDELVISSKSSFDLPNGSFARWENGD